MKRKALPVFFALTLMAVIGAVRAAEGGATWQTDYAAALKEAKATNKPILADFTGSDWCGWCIKLQKETFSQPAFAEFAKDNVILLELDYPQSKEQSAAIKKQNAKLQEQYKIDGFPTLVLIGSNGKELDRNVGYLAGGPAAMIQWIKKETAKK